MVLRRQVGDANPIGEQAGPGRRKGTRELIEPYIIVYKVDDDRDVVTIIAVAHGARDR